MYDVENIVILYCTQNKMQKWMIKWSCHCIMNQMLCSIYLQFWHTNVVNSKESPSASDVSNNNESSWLITIKLQELNGGDSINISSEGASKRSVHSCIIFQSVVSPTLGEVEGELILDGAATAKFFDGGGGGCNCKALWQCWRLRTAGRLRALSPLFA